ncbi:MAG: hypothetical protein FWE37_05765 [Spirochaetaceae bacterium]|nr:hypothetical protein [Spirochaetaceae bacterium]
MAEKREVSRIFTKVINPLALDKGTYGTERGHLSKSIISYGDIVYNRDNFRDIGKLPQGLTRKEATDMMAATDNYNKRLIEKAKEVVRKYHPFSEVLDNKKGKTGHIHHIFEQSNFPSIAAYLENLIALTVGQHLENAHLNSNTHTNDVLYQVVCLRAKSLSIERALSNGDLIYSKPNFIFVINTGLKLLETENEIKQTADFDSINKQIASFYKTL